MTVEKHGKAPKPGLERGLNFAFDLNPSAKVDLEACCNARGLQQLDNLIQTFAHIGESTIRQTLERVRSRTTHTPIE